MMFEAVYTWFLHMSCTECREAKTLGGSVCILCELEMVGLGVEA